MGAVVLVRISSTCLCDGCDSSRQQEVYLSGTVGRSADWGGLPLNIVCKLHTSHVTFHHEDVEPDAVVPLIFISSI